MMAGKGTFLGVDSASDRVRYYIAHAVGATPMAGVAVVRIEFDRIEADWESAGERVLVTDTSGTVFLSSDGSFKYRRLAAPGAASEPQYGSGAYPENKAPINFKVLEQRGDGQIIQVQTPLGLHSYLYQAMPLRDYGWTIHRLSDLATIESDQRDGAIIGAAISVIAVSGLLYLRQRQTRTGRRAQGRRRAVVGGGGADA